VVVLVVVTVWISAVPFWMHAFLARIILLSFSLSVSLGSTKSKGGSKSARSVIAAAVGVC
jgi:hypothetical protein